MFDFDIAAQAIVKLGNQLYRQGSLPATSGNLSVRLKDGSIAITVSGSHKGILSKDDIMRVDRAGKPLDHRRPSAETLLHTQIYEKIESANIVAHPHSVNATVLSRVCPEKLSLEDYELLKAFPGIDSHESRYILPVFENDQNIPRLVETINAYGFDRFTLPGYMIRGHGFYTWGDQLEDALRHLEAFEFLFDCELQLRKDMR